MSQLTVLFNSVILRKTLEFVKSGDRNSRLGKLIFGDLIVGGILLFIAGVGFLIIYIGLRKGFD